MRRPIKLALAIMLCAIALGAVTLASGQMDQMQGGVMMPGGDNACRYCGMDLDKFKHSAMEIHYPDGTVARTCSIRCAAIDLAANAGMAPASITVGDFNTKEQIDARGAVWVVDAKNPGVMTGRAKWAFGGRDAAMAYTKEHSGQVTGFDDALRAAYSDMYDDNMMMQRKRAMKMKQTGMGQ